MPYAQSDNFEYVSLITTILYEILLHEVLGTFEAFTTYNDIIRSILGH
jgi:hypothetical protein